MILQQVTLPMLLTEPGLVVCEGFPAKGWVTEDKPSWVATCCDAWYDVDG